MEKENSFESPPSGFLNKKELKLLAMKKTTLDILKFIAKIISDKKGMNILALDLKGLSSITDYCIIAEGNVGRHVMSIAQGISKEMSLEGVRSLRHEGMKVGDWVVLDYGEIMVHLFSSGLREKYSLERLWPESEIIEISETLLEKHPS